jgi:hypothetical protein
VIFGMLVNIITTIIVLDDNKNKPHDYVGFIIGHFLLKKEPVLRPVLSVISPMRNLA